MIIYPLFGRRQSIIVCVTTSKLNRHVYEIESHPDYLYFWDKHIIEARD